MTERLDVVVIGAGVVGLAVARALAIAGRDVTIVEAAPAIGTGVSSRNSEVVHAGIHYRPDSLKARLCVRGKALMYAYCVARHVTCRRIGKLVVATDPSQRDALEHVLVNARASGVDDLEPLTAAQVATLEPAVACVAAAWCPSTGIVDSHALMLALLADAEAHGATLALSSRVVGGSVEPNGVVLRVVGGAAGGDGAGGSGSGGERSGGSASRNLGEQSGGEVTGHGFLGGATRAGAHVDETDAIAIEAALVVNCASLDATRIAAAIDGVPAASIPTMHLAKGSYFTLAGRAPFRHLIYPLPEPGGLGIHVTPDLGGQVKFGPDVEWLRDGAPGAPLDYTVNPHRVHRFASTIRRYWPGLPDDALAPAYAGIRPKLSGPDDPAADFVIAGPEAHGVAGLINLFGIDSPGLTSSLAIAEHVAALAS